MALRKKLAALALALPLLSLTPAFATPAQTPRTPEATPSTTHSLIVADFNRRFAKAGPHRQILFMDRDDIGRRMAQMPRGVTRDTALPKAVQDYVLERTGQRLPEEYAAAIGSGLDSGGGQALPVAIDDKGGGGSICIITGQNPDMSGRAYQQRIMGLDAGLYDDFRTRPMLRQLPPDISAAFTDYHELGHCMDNYYIKAFLDHPELRHDLENAIAITHKGEAFGEIFAALMLARDGEMNVAGIRADHRLVGMATTGSVLAQAAGWEDLAKYAGFIYALQDVLWDAQREIDRLGPEKIRAMSPQEIAVLAHQITERDLMSAPGTDHAVTYLLQNKFNLAVWEKLGQDVPHIAERYTLALRVRDHIAQAFLRVFGAEAFDASRPVYQQLARDLPPGEPAPQTPDAEQSRRAVSRMAETLRHNTGRHDDPEMQIMLNAAREKESLRLMLNDAALTAAARQQAMTALALMPEAMRMAVLTLRQNRQSIPSIDNHVRLMIPLQPAIAPG